MIACVRLEDDRKTITLKSFRTKARAARDAGCWPAHRRTRRLRVGEVAAVIEFAVAGAVAGPAGADARAATSAKSSAEHLVGEGKYSATTRGVSRQLVVSAHGIPGDAHGNARINFTGFNEQQWSVECLFSTGNRAIASGTLDEPLELGGLSFPYFEILVEDNGEPSDAIADRALVLVSTFSFADAPDCGLAFVAALGPTVALEQGNVLLKDRS
jgi:hypothetical protein